MRGALNAINLGRSLSDDDWGFSIKYPATWSAHPKVIKEKDRYQTILSNELQFAEAMSLTVSINTKQIKFGQFPFQVKAIERESISHIREFHQAFQDNLEGGTLIAGDFSDRVKRITLHYEEIITLAGHPASRLVCLFAFQLSPAFPVDSTAAEIFTLLAGDRAFQLTCCLDPQKYRDQFLNIKKIMESLTIEEPKVKGGSRLPR
jgi:hypothetical protein